MKHLKWAVRPAKITWKNGNYIDWMINTEEKQWNPHKSDSKDFCLSLRGNGEMNHKRSFQSSVSSAASVFLHGAQNSQFGKNSGIW